MIQAEIDKMVLLFKIVRDSLFGNHVPTKESQDKIYKNIHRMRTEEKSLLLRDLSARLPYGVMCEINNHYYELVNVDIKRELVYLLRDGYYTPWSILRGDIVKPCLRPLSNMTEEERWDFGIIFNSFEYLKLELLENGLSFHEIYDITRMCNITWNELNTAIDWLNAHHIDYRGLIKKGLAIEAPEGMYNLK